MRDVRGLPLTPGAAWQRAGSLAVIGPNGNSSLVLQGNYGGAYCAPGPHGPAYDCEPSIFEALQRGYAPGAVYLPGSGIASGDAAMLAAAAAAASAADATVLVLGLDQTLEREQLDRYDNISLPAAQAALLDAVAAAARTLIVVLVHGGALDVATLAGGADAMLDALYPGVTGGAAVADALFGAYNPGGKLPYTVYVDSEYSPLYNFTSMAIAAPQGNSTGGRTYRYHTGSPTFPFGFGLSYTDFSLAWASPPPAPAILSPAAPNLTLSVSVRNIGDVAGDEVPQLYVAATRGSCAPTAPTYIPLRSLRGFERVSLAPGDDATVEFGLRAADDLRLTRDDGSQAVLNCLWQVTVSRGHGAALAFNLSTEGF